MLDKITSLFDSLGVARSSQNNSVVLVDLDLFASSQLFGGGVFQFHSSFFGNNGSAGKKSQILHCCLAVVSKSWSLNGANLNTSSELVDHQSSQGFAFDIFGNNQQRALALDDRLQNRNELLQTANLLFNQQNVGIFQHTFLCLGIGDKVGTDESAFELHSFDDFQFIIESLSVLDGDNTFLANSFHGIGNQFSNFGISVGGNSSDLRNFFLAGDGTANFREGVHNRVDGHIDAPSQILWVQASGDGLATLGINRTG
mmetsp:Transcript_2415/g.5244  ORF Transcript_2415/g.5244 Transcript_2415/m.5244 type:complete len:257 (-) Transcript_2415:388-1158(-)